MRTVIHSVKQLGLATGVINTLPVNVQRDKHLTIVEWIAKLNNNPLEYGVVYYIDESCITIK